MAAGTQGDMSSQHVEHGALVHVGMLAVCLVAVLVRRWLGRVYERVEEPGVVPQPAWQEKSGMTAERDDDLESQSPLNAASGTKTPLDRALLLWALVTLPMNVAAWVIPNVFWSRTISPPLSLSVRMSLALMGLSPVLASLRILISTLQRTTSNPTSTAELCHTMLDGAITAPLWMFWLWYVFPARVQVAGAAAAGAGAVQAAGWMWFVCRRRFESSRALAVKI